MYSKRKMNRSLKKRQRVNGGRKIIIIVACIIFSTAILSLCLLERRALIKRNAKPVDGEQTIWTAKDTIPQGTVLTEELLSKVNGVMPVGGEFLVGDEVIGKKARQQIPKGMILYEFLVSEPLKEESQREIECDVVRLSKNLQEQDYADIRLKLPNGEDYIVLAKKQIHNLTEGEDGISFCYLWMEEEEILNLQAAVVDAYLYPGAYLYTAKYIEPGYQKESYVTYVPPLATIELMKKDQNLLTQASDLLKEQRKSIENRLMDYRNEKMREKEFDWTMEQETTDKTVEDEVIFEEEVP